LAKVEVWPDYYFKRNNGVAKGSRALGNQNHNQVVARGFKCNLLTLQTLRIVPESILNTSGAELDK